MALLTANAELRRIGVRNWTLPAFVVTLPDGSRFNVCPNAGPCARLCYARFGTYQFAGVKAAHLANLMLTLENLDGWVAQMAAEVGSDWFRPTGTPSPLLPALAASGGPEDPWVARWLRQGGKAVRVHDAGDFYSDDYTLAWLDVAWARPDVLFYAYTKEVSRFRRIVEPDAPPNFRWLYSLGRLEDHLLDLDADRHADVFPDRESLVAAGYTDQSENDLLAVLLPTTRVGIPANNLPVARKRQGDRSFGGLAGRRGQKLTDPVRFPYLA